MQKPPPRPVQEGEGKGTTAQPPPDRRQVFANRGRTASSGSTRGAFGMTSDPTNQDGGNVPNVVYSGNKRKPDEEQGNGDGGLPRDLSNLRSGYGSNQKTIRDFAASPERQYYANVDVKSLEEEMRGGHAKSYAAVEQRRNDDWASEGDSSQYTISNERFLFWKTYFFDPANPEFTSRQQTSWAVILGIIMGLFTAVWSEFIEWCIDVTWVKIPKLLLRLGVFTDLDGYFPLPHYMWVCPAIYGGILSYITAMYGEKKTPVPGQNEWIETLHSVGIMDHTMYFPMIFLSTAGMASGLSLGPEMPLVVTGGMVGSLLGSLTRQSVLSARVMNLTSSAAGIAGFFGLPMAGALFVLELPHRMGMQYFEAVSPAIVASIVSVIVNRVYTQDEVHGMFTYPFINNSLPSHIFYIAVIYGLVGCIAGLMYSEGVLWLKHWVHEWFHVHHDDHDHDDHGGENAHSHGEIVPLVGESKPAAKKKKFSLRACIGNMFGIPYEPYRAAVAGVLVGIITGVICMYLPINLFWGEAQLQTLIDKGKTPLPVFEYGEEPIAALTAYGYCMVDQSDEDARAAGFSMTCAGIITLTKIFVVGISLGTGVCGGHFWAPLFVGCAAAQFFNDLMSLTAEEYGFGQIIGAYPCAAIICIMGATHVVTFRAHIAIMLILTLTITSFSEGKGDFAAIFPLLVIACFVPMNLKITRDSKFYAKQRNRGDITAVPEVLCEPYKAGKVQVGNDDYYDEYSGSSYSGSDTGISMDGDSIPSESRHSLKINTGEESASRTGKTGSRSDGSVRSSSSRPSSRSKERPVLTRMNSRGQIVDFQPSLLNQGRELASTRSRNNSRSSTPVNLPIPPSSTKGHRRTKSGNSVRSGLPTPSATGTAPSELDSP